MKGPTMWQRLERKISFLCLFVYLFIFFCHPHFSFFPSYFFCYPHFSIRIFPSASAIRRHPVRVLQTPLNISVAEILGNNINPRNGWEVVKRTQANKSENLQRVAWKIFMYCNKIILNKYKHISSLIMFISNHNKV